MNLNKYFISVEDYLNKVGSYLNEKTYKYLYSLNKSHDVLVNGNEIWFDDSQYIDEIFSPTLFLPKYQLDNLRVIIENKLVGVALYSLDESYGCVEDILLKPVGLIASDNKLIEYDTLAVKYSCRGHIGLSGHGGKIINEGVCCTNSCYGVLQTANNTQTMNYTPTNQISNSVSAVGNATKFILDNWFTTEELVLLDKATSETLTLLYKMKVIDGFVDLATKEVYSHALLDGTLSDLTINDITFEGNRSFKYSYKGIDFTFRVCYNKTTNRLFIRTFTCDEGVDPRLKSFVEKKLNDILISVPVAIKESAKVLETVITEVREYTDKLYEELVKSCPVGKEDYLSIINNYPLQLMNGNPSQIVNQVLLDYYSNK